MDIRRILGLLHVGIRCCSSTRVVSMVKDTSIHAVKAMTMNEPFFQGIPPGRPIMPRVLIVEALAQAGSVLAIESLGLAGSGKLVCSGHRRGEIPPSPWSGSPARPARHHPSGEAEHLQVRGQGDAGRPAGDQFTAMIADPPGDETWYLLSPPRT